MCVHHEYISIDSFVSHCHIGVLSESNTRFMNIGRCWMSDNKTTIHRLSLMFKVYSGTASFLLSFELSKLFFQNWKQRHANTVV